MFGDPWPEEPGDPYEKTEAEREAEPDLEELTPDVPDEGQADPELFRTFWTLVATINLGVLAVSLGLMLVGFRGRWTVGGAAFLLGVGVLAWSWYRYRAYRNG